MGGKWLFFQIKIKPRIGKPGTPSMSQDGVSGWLVLVDAVMQPLDEPRLLVPCINWAHFIGLAGLIPISVNIPRTNK